MKKLTLKPDALAKINWGRPDSPTRPICAICHGALPEVPLMLWKADGSGASLCDKCVEQATEN